MRMKMFLTGKVRHSSGHKVLLLFAVGFFCVLVTKSQDDSVKHPVVQHEIKFNEPAVVIPGSAAVAFNEWTIPTHNSMAHDPLAAPDGSVWYTGFQTNQVGRLDPQTGEFKEYPLKTPDSKPHGLVADKEGNIWFTAEWAGYLGKLDPRTGEITEYHMPDPKALDPHTPLFDQKGNLWFTLQHSDMLGKMNTATGTIKLATVPTPDARPYGMVVNSKGVPFFVEFNSNKLASIDPETMEIREYVLPNPGARPRRIAITPDDVLWYTDYVRGYLGRFDPKTGKATEWPSPSGPKSQPYGIAATGRSIWYSESGTDKATLVRFDTETLKFQSWVIPSSDGGIVRNMMPSKNGDLWLACSAPLGKGINLIVQAIVKKT